MIEYDELEKALEGSTKGPWGWENAHPQNACATVFSKNEDGWNEEVATLYHAPGDNASQDANGIWRPHSGRDTNAALIASAPDTARIALAARKALDDMNITTMLAHALSDGLIDESVAHLFEQALQDQNDAIAAFRRAEAGE